MTWYVSDRFEIIDSRNAEIVCKVDDDMELLKEKIHQLKKDNHDIQFYYLVDINQHIRIIPIMLMLV